MEFNELPFKHMDRHCSPRPDAFEWLEQHSIPYYITCKYKDPKDQGIAFNGAFTAFHIHTHVSKNIEHEEDWLIEVLGWYDWHEMKDLNSPFYDALEETLKSCGMEDFYKRSIDYIIDNKGILE